MEWSNVETRSEVVENILTDQASKSHSRSVPQNWSLPFTTKGSYDLKTLSILRENGKKSEIRMLANTLGSFGGFFGWVFASAKELEAPGLLRNFFLASSFFNLQQYSWYRYPSSHALLLSRYTPRPTFSSQGRPILSSGKSLHSRLSSCPSSEPP